MNKSWLVAVLTVALTLGATHVASASSIVFTKGR